MVNKLDQFPLIESTVCDDRSLKTVSKRKKNPPRIHIHIYIYLHMYTGEFHMNARQTASRVFDSSRLSRNKCDTSEPAITLFVPGDAFPRPSIGGNVHLENSSPPSLRFRT